MAFVVSTMSIKISSVRLADIRSPRRRKAQRATMEIGPAPQHEELRLEAFQQCGFALVPRIARDDACQPVGADAKDGRELEAGREHVGSAPPGRTHRLRFPASHALIQRDNRLFERATRLSLFASAPQ